MLTRKAVGDITYDWYSRIFVTSTGLGLVVLLARLFVVSGYDPATAIDIAGSAGFFSLMLAICLNVLPVLVACLTSGLLLVAADKSLRKQPFDRWFGPLVAIQLALCLFLVPVEWRFLIPVGTSALSFWWVRLMLHSEARTRVQSRAWRGAVYGCMALAFGSLLALTAEAVFMDNQPWGRARTYSIAESTGVRDQNRTSTIVGFQLSDNGSSTVILNYLPRRTIVVPTVRIRDTSICSLSSEDRDLPLVPAIMEVLKRTDRLSAHIPSCYS